MYINKVTALRRRVARPQGQVWRGGHRRLKLACDRKWRDWLGGYPVRVTPASYLAPLLGCGVLADDAPLVGAEAADGLTYIVAL
jgi:hypothetical protein